MSKLREAAQQVLEWLDKESWPGFDEWVQEGRAIRASLRAALAEQAQPVAELVARELERLAQDPPISGNTLAQARVLMAAASLRQFGLGGRAQRQPQEPVAYWLHGTNRVELDRQEEYHSGTEWTPLYTHPAPQRQSQDEPVAKVELMTTGGNAGLATRIVEIDDHLRERLRPGQMLYTHPAPQREPLTQYEAWEIWDALADRGKKGEDIVHAFARAIERAHGIGGQDEVS